MTVLSLIPRFPADHRLPVAPGSTQALAFRKEDKDVPVGPVFETKYDLLRHAVPFLVLILLPDAGR